MVELTPARLDPFAANAGNGAGGNNKSGNADSSDM